jgi:hypothetical protein
MGKVSPHSSPVTMGVLLPRRRVFLTRLIARLILFTSLVFALCASFCGLPACVDSALGRVLFGLGRSAASSSRKGRDAKSSFERLDMTAAECSAAFPGLTKEIEIAVARGPFELKKMPNHATGMVQGRIEDGKVGFSRFPVRFGYIRC